MGCILGKLTTAPGSSLFFPAAAVAAAGGGGDKAAELQLQAPPQEHIAAVTKDASGWPLWLSEAAGDALWGWAPRGAEAFQKLEKIGSGTYNNVYKAIDVESGRVVALKKVRVDGVGEAESARFMAREIALLRRLGDHPHVVRLEGLVTSRLNTAPSLYLVFEYMEHDLTGLTACATASGRRLSLPQKSCLLVELGHVVVVLLHGPLFLLESLFEQNWVSQWRMLLIKHKAKQSKHKAKQSHMLTFISLIRSSPMVHYMLLCHEQLRGATSKYFLLEIMLEAKIQLVH